MKTTTSLDAILGDFKPTEPAPRRMVGRYPTYVTIRLSSEGKARFQRLQEMSRGTGRKFSDIAREALEVLMALAESKAG